jgi:hypothetical protein
MTTAPPHFGAKGAHDLDRRLLGGNETASTGPSIVDEESVAHRQARALRVHGMDGPGSRARSSA